MRHAGLQALNPAIPHEDAGNRPGRRSRRGVIGPSDRVCTAEVLAKVGSVGSDCCGRSKSSTVDFLLFTTGTGAGGKQQRGGVLSPHR